MSYQIYNNPVTATESWKRLGKLVNEVSGPEKHLRTLISENDRITSFSIEKSGILYDFSRQRITKTILKCLHELAEERGATDFFNKMASGETVNITEHQPALHTVKRAAYIDPAGNNSEIYEIKKFAGQIRNGELRGSTGKAFKHAVVTGIGGSHLGTAFAAAALKDFSDRRISLHFLSNVDYSGFTDLVECIDPETTLWIVISKSFTTSEVANNAWIAWNFMKESVPDASAHFVAISASEKAAESEAPKFSRVFSMPDGIGGRYSATSAVGILPLSLYLGFENVLEMLEGACEMDRHACESHPEKNMPLTSALIGIWNNCFLDYPAKAIIPYSNRLSLLPPHIQQLYMESSGKSVTGSGDGLQIPSGVIILGDTGTNAQHSFFQLIHQGRPFPVEFIGVLKPFRKQGIPGIFGISNHQELWANMIAQAEALAIGRDSDDPAKICPGNRPSSIIAIDSITPENTGRLLSFYEARTVYEAFISGYNPFDQFGVETGKLIASDIRQKMISSPDNKKSGSSSADFYIEKL